MSKNTWTLFAGLVVTIVTAGCGQPTPAPTVATSDPKATVAPAENKVLLHTKPADAKPVGELRTSAADGADVVILGRIGGDTNPWVEGRAAFTIVDTKLEPCKPEEGCPTPWDYCCSTDLIPANRAMIKFVDDVGETIEQDARKLLGVKELQTVVVQGKVKKDESGNLTVLASGIFVVPETK